MYIHIYKYIYIYIYICIAITHIYNYVKLSMILSLYKYLRFSEDIYVHLYEHMPCKALGGGALDVFVKMFVKVPVKVFM